jgi:hypothetical protein
MFPEKLYLRQEFWGLEPGTEFTLQSDPERYTAPLDGGVLEIPAGLANEQPEWFSDDEPRAAAG